jgi:GNAT superfamily N-acetyltransferase
VTAAPVVADAVDVRAATLDDIPGIREVLAAYGDDDGPDAPIDVIGPALRHLLGRGSLVVAEDGADGTVIGFGGVAWSGFSSHLTDLFIRPGRTGGGVGKRLLAALYTQPGPRTTFGSDDPRAIPLYVRQGMGAWWPNLYVDGSPEALPAPPSAIVCQPADAVELDALESSWTGFSRADDHAFWASLPEARPFIVTLRDEPVAIVHARRRRRGEGRWIERAVVAPTAHPVEPLLAAFVHAAEGGPIAGCVAGPSPLLPRLLHAGFRVADHDTFMASPGVTVDPDRLMPHPGLL